MPLTPPAIPPVPGGEARPLWSVMIPTYNCAHYLRETLASVLAQAPAPDAMQIEVIDDCSGKDDPAAVVRELSPDGRVVFFRQPANAGAIGNFNTCIARSRGHLVHILHGDDFVQPGFYRAIENLAQQNPDLALFATRSWEVGPGGEINGLSTRYPSLEKTSRLPPELFVGTGLRFPAVVIRRSFYEQHGGFLPALPHTADMEMWVRAISRTGGICLNAALASYRSHETNDTAAMMRSGRGLRCYLNCLALIAPHFPPGAIDSAVETTAKRALGYSWFNWRTRNRSAAKTYYRIWKSATSLPQRPLHLAAWMIDLLQKAAGRRFRPRLAFRAD